MSKINTELLESSVKKILAFSRGEEIETKGEKKQGKVRKFQETIELQVALKNYDVKKDKKFVGTFQLPHVPRPNMRVCVLANAKHVPECEAAGVDYRTVDDLKALNKNKKLVKKLAKKYDVFLASDTVIRQVPRLLGPGLNRAGKFPSMVSSSEDLSAKIVDARSTIKFQLKKVLCMNVAVGNVGMPEDQIVLNVQLACNFLASLLKKGWQNIGVMYVKSTMGPSFQIYF